MDRKTVFLLILSHAILLAVAVTGVENQRPWTRSFTTVVQIPVEANDEIQDLYQRSARFYLQAAEEACGVTPRYSGMSGGSLSSAEPSKVFSRGWESSRFSETSVGFQEAVMLSEDDASGDWDMQTAVLLVNTADGLVFTNRPYGNGDYLSFEYTEKLRKMAGDLYYIRVDFVGTTAEAHYYEVHCRIDGIGFMSKWLSMWLRR